MIRKSLDMYELEKQSQKLIKGNFSISKIIAFDKRILENTKILHEDIS